jgi:hypothetical protein
MRFRYALDPLCAAACLLYATNRWLVPATVKGSFLRGHFNDLLLIPAALPLVLWVQRRLALRRGDEPPGLGEVGLHTVLWACMAEFVAPSFTAHAVADWRDLFAYAAGKSKWPITTSKA